ncbi:luciferase family oxidoreductase, group 1 [Thioalkalivibrio sp. K90mix]|uniref:LLM class flavin-dependent oxidoreductase n=1 Tax=Thioalkalivibrio sp. (strain K90mix) TaxID=396595 RepID=UPI000195AB7F|nr:LLM class flavin-dependent oxidoreductase [Thioalkalivibrio sp. K90mix]ADC71863.1 luciferase family oxidoreductase, group 1 [Thioalkalivibrio sp. K90mix]
MTQYSVLDLAPITAHADAGQALHNTLDLAQLAETLGFGRYWLAEHHNMPGIASAATAVVIGQVAAATTRIRVGAGGIMLPNHAPLIVAEQFGTLNALFPGRIDLGLGRAPGTDPATARALRRSAESDPDQFPRDVAELQSYLADPVPDQAIRAIPGAGSRVPVWILGSSLFGAQLAAYLGLPYAFASHFAPGQLHDAIAIYRREFRPSPELDAPWVMAGYNVYVADTDTDAQTLASSMEQAFISLRRGRPEPIQPPIPHYREQLDRAERAMVEQTMACSAIGAPDTVEREMRRFLEATQADELILTTTTFDHEARRRSLALTAQVCDRLSRS